MDVGSWQMIAGLVVGISVLVGLILYSRIHAFPALIIAAITTGLVGGMPFSKVIASVTKGFGGTLGSIGIIIGFGIMMGAIFEKSGAAKRMAKVFLKLFGKGREELALATTGFIVSIPIFCDSGFVILSPLAKAISRATGKSLITLGVALAAGLVITHHLIPPTPGPVASAEYFNVPLGDMILFGLLLAIPLTIASIIYARYIGNKVFRLPAQDSDDGFVDQPYAIGAGGQWMDADDSKLPSAWKSFAPILIPVVLILLGTFTTALVPKAERVGLMFDLIDGLGSPVVAVGIGLVFAAFFLTDGMSRKDVVNTMDDSVKQAGIILLVTGGGGALGMVLRDSGAGTHVANLIATMHLPAVILPLAIATIVRLMQGSGTVAMVTSASIVAPMAATLGLNPTLGALACCTGAFIFSYFNDSYYWVVTRMLGVSDVREQIRIWSVTTTICWAVGCTILIVAGFFI